MRGRRCPSHRRSRLPRRTRGPLFHVLAPPAAGRQVRRRRGFRWRAPGQSTLDLTSRTQVAGDRASSRTARGRPELARGRARQRNRRRPGDGRRLRLPKEPFNLATQGQRQPGSAFKPFTLVTALEQGHLARSGVHLGAAGDPLPGAGPGARPAAKVVDESSTSTTTRTSTSGQRLDRHRDDVLRQLGVLAARHPGRPANVAATANEMGVQTDLSTRRPSTPIDGGPFEPYNPALILGGLETGVTPLEMAHAYLTLRHNGQLVSGTMADSPADPVAIHEGQRRAARRRRRPGRRPSTAAPGEDKVETKQVLVPDRRRHRARRSWTRSSPRGPARTRTPATPPMGQDRDDRRTTATPGSAAGTRTSRSPSGSATPTRQADADRVRRRAGRRRHDPGADLERDRHRLRAAESRQAEEDGRRRPTAPPARRPPPPAPHALRPRRRRPAPSEPAAPADGGARRRRRPSQPAEATPPPAAGGWRRPAPGERRRSGVAG